jgi:hypothetical protein
VVQPTAEQNEATPAPASTELKATAVSTPPAVSSTTTNANVTVDLEDLHYAVTGWARAHGRSPTNFEEFASTCGFQMPPPPPGKKYVFGSKYHVLLVNK